MKKRMFFCAAILFVLALVAPAQQPAPAFRKPASTQPAAAPAPPHESAAVLAAENKELKLQIAQLRAQLAQLTAQADELQFQLNLYEAASGHAKQRQDDQKAVSEAFTELQKLTPKPPANSPPPGPPAGAPATPPAAAPPR